MILLDTHALLWLETNGRRARPLHRFAGSLYVSPVCLLELQLLVECGRLRLKRSLSTVADDPRWALDAPPSVEWFERAFDLSWTRDLFDRLLAAHALYRGWKLATADAVILEHLGAKHVLEL
ncbi:MAG: type II toxin-antitoxin system VapC family toxin [Myxococcota bacterium]